MAARLKRFLIRLRADEDGQALVEFALVLPVVVLLVLGILDFGKAYNYKNDLTSLANQAARLAEVNSCSPCASGQKIGDYVKGTADSPTLRNSTTGATIQFCFPDGSTGQPGKELKVTASYNYTWLPELKSAHSTLRSSVIVRVQAQYDNTAYTATACT